MPYISASIVVQLLTVAVPHFAKMQKEGDSGRKKLNQFTRVLTIFITMAQGYSYLNVGVPAFMAAFKRVAAQTVLELAGTTLSRCPAPFR